MKKKLRKIPIIKDARYWHLYYVYQDPDFVDRVSTLKEVLSNAALDVEATKKSGTPKYSAQIEQELADLQDVFAIEREQVLRFNQESPPLNPVLISAGLNEGGLIEIIVSPEITQPQLLSLWSLIEVVKQNAGIKKRARGTDNPGLIYAIGKARRQGLKFLEIFRKLEEKTLPAYSGSNPFKSPEKMADFYRKYKYP